MWAMDERENRDYIGLYELVADKLKRENELADNEFRRQMIDAIILPFYKKQIVSKLNHIVTVIDKTENLSLIYPKNKQVILNPIKIKDENGNILIRYFIFLPNTNQAFEWTLVKPNILNKNEYADNPINNTIGTLTQWDFSYKTLDDSVFWDQKVLLRDATGNFKYLKKLQ